MPVLIALAHDLLITAGVYAIVRSGGDDRHGRRPADDHGLLAVRHGDRVRPNTRERAAHAAGHVLADREPVDVGGLHAVARHELRGADAGGLAAPVRRRDAEGLRLRAARGRALGRLLVDLHRDAGAGGVEGARAHLHAPPPADAAGVRRPHPGLPARRAGRAAPAVAAAGAERARRPRRDAPRPPRESTRADQPRRPPAAPRGGRPPGGRGRPSSSTTRTAQRPRPAPPRRRTAAATAHLRPRRRTPREPPSPPPERAAQPSAETPASPSAPAAPSSPPSKPKAKSKRQRRRKHGRR